MSRPLAPRSDAELRSAVIEELGWAPDAGAANVHVEVSGGAVTLSGTVGSYPERLRAGHAALRVRGVLALAQEITVQGSWDAVTDTEIARHAGEALHRAVNIPASVTVTVSDHEVVLAGDVAWEYQRQAAEHAVQYAPGVRSVVNLIELRPVAGPAGARPAAVESAIRAALVRRAGVEASQVTVTAVGGVVTLAGTVLSWDERRQVEDACWSAPGVAVVENALTIVPTPSELRKAST